MKFVLVKTNGEAGVVDINYDNFLDECYNLLDCSCIEFACCEDNYRFIIDESGKIKEPPKELNRCASMIYPPVPFDYLAGDVLIGKLDPNDPSEFTSLDEDDLFHLEWLLNVELEEL